MVNPIQLQKFLKGVDYPASKATLIENAKNLGADENVCSTLEQLPDDDFQTPAEVSQAVGQVSGSDDGQAQHEASSQNADQAFLAHALEDSLAEVELCHMAMERCESDDVRVFAQRMIDEHGRMGQEIEKLAGKSRADLPKDEKPEHKKVMQEMRKLSGAQFDQRFMDYNVQEHEKDIKVFGHYAEQASDQSIKAMAEKAVQMLEAHLKMARDICQRLKE